MNLWKSENSAHEALGKLASQNIRTCDLKRVRVAHRPFSGAATQAPAESLGALESCTISIKSRFGGGAGVGQGEGVSERVC